MAGKIMESARRKPMRTNWKAKGKVQGCQAFFVADTLPKPGVPDRGLAEASPS